MNSFLDKAYDLGIKILKNHTNTIQGYNFNEYFTINPHLFDDSMKISRHSFREIGLLNDLGVLQFYMGNHNDAFNLCTRSLQILKSYHGLICIGVSLFQKTFYNYTHILPYIYTGFWDILE